MKKQQLISSYNRKNDILVGKISGRNGFYADYSISDEIYLAIGNDKLPSSIFVNNASQVLNISKQLLYEANIKIRICCNGFLLKMNLFINDFKIKSVIRKNIYGIPKIDLLIG